MTNKELAYFEAIPIREFVEDYYGKPGILDDKFYTHKWAKEKCRDEGCDLQGVDMYKTPKEEFYCGDVILVMDDAKKVGAYTNPCLSFYGMVTDYSYESPKTYTLKKGE